ncbi:MAG: hypothetical protein U0842_10675 [Candidatus Binatia bacterium]
MEAWMWIALGSLVIAIAVPLLMRSMRERNPEKVAEEQREQQAVFEKATEVLEGMLRALRDGGTVHTGPGTPVYDAIAQLRPRIRKSFTLSAASEFDREIGFELNRPGALALGVPAVEGRVERALRALRNAMAA